MFAKFSVFVSSILVATMALAADATSVTFSDVAARPSYAKVGLGYFTVTSTGADAITGVTSDCCKAVEIHRTEKINGTMRMRRIPELVLKKGKAVRIQPDSAHGEHLMFIGLKQPLKANEKVAVTFTFTKAPPQTVTFPVVAPKASATGLGEPAEAHHH
jgi:copper(I)-binding protein